MNRFRLIDGPAVRALIAGNAGALLIVGYLAFAPASTAVPPLTAGEAEALSLQAPTRPAPRADHAAITQKPLFHASRARREVQRQEVRQTASGPTAVTPSKTYRLSGIVAMPGGVFVAYVTKTGSGESLGLKVGDIIDEWSVTAITRDQVTFSSADKTDQLAMKQ